MQAPTTTPTPGVDSITPSTRRRGRPRKHADDATRKNHFRLRQRLDLGRKFSRDDVRHAFLSRYVNRPEGMTAAEHTDVWELAIKAWDAADADDWDAVKEFFEQINYFIDLAKFRVYDRTVGLDDKRGIFLRGAPHGKSKLVSGGYDGTKVALIDGIRQTRTGRVKPKGNAPDNFTSVSDG